MGSENSTTRVYVERNHGEVIERVRLLQVGGQDFSRGPIKLAVSHRPKYGIDEQDTLDITKHAHTGTQVYNSVMSQQLKSIMDLDTEGLDFLLQLATKGNSFAVCLGLSCWEFDGMLATDYNHLTTIVINHYAQR